MQNGIGHLALTSTSAMGDGSSNVLQAVAGAMSRTLYN
jgi:hypothetical protein